MTEIERKKVAHLINKLAVYLHQNNVEKGFWERKRNDGECIALMHSELSEALDSIRQENNPCDPHLPEYENTVIEFADCIIRILDYCASKHFPIGEAILAKVEFNKTRPYKRGKKF